MVNNPNPTAYPTAPPQNYMGNNSQMKSFDDMGSHQDGGFLDNFSKLRGDDERQGFVVKVFGIMGVQTLVTGLFVAYVALNEGSRSFFSEKNPLLYISFVATIGIMYALVCFKSIARAVPTNYILLGIFTICESFIVATIAAEYDPESVLMAAIYAVGLFSILTIYACSTKGDIGCMGPIIMTSVILGFLTLFLVILFPSRTMTLIFCWVGLIITCIYVIYDVYLITEKHGLDYDDYIIGALLIYLDLINLFIYILSIIGDRR